MAQDYVRVAMLLRASDQDNMTYLHEKSNDAYTEVARRALAFLAAYERDKEKGIDWLRRAPHRDELEIITVL